MTESSDSPDPLANPQDYADLQAELQSLAIDYDPIMATFWPRLQDHKHRWELHSYGLPNEYGRQVATDIVTLLNEPQEHRRCQQQARLGIPHSRQPLSR